MIDAERRLEAVLRLGALRVVGAGVVHQHVKLLMLRAEVCSQLPNRVERRQVGEHQLDVLVAALSFDVIERRAALGRVARHESDGRAHLRQRECSLFADAAIGAGDQADLAVHGSLCAHALPPAVRIARAPFEAA